MLWPLEKTSAGQLEVRIYKPLTNNKIFDLSKSKDFAVSQLNVSQKIEDL